ncbi:transcription factor with AP2 domain(s) [Babesia ovis]|uniref:Transcription factor with AP2 domain(S) n=1 Tax=Babesia ovis TaxID=5869 RepID=A0A9W5WWA8_BABOV|nr:transcription factor with AP2 domain(s) [Babesia ovis]
MDSHLVDMRLDGDGGHSTDHLSDDRCVKSPYVEGLGINKQSGSSSSCTTLCDSGDESQSVQNGGQNDCNGLQQNYPVNYNYQQPFNNFDLASFINSSFNKKHGNVISGVKFQPSDNRWIARWTTADGKRACKSFSVNIYGFEQARALAIEARQKGVSLSGRSFCNRERQHAMRSGVGIIGIRFDKTQARWVSSYYEGGKRKFRYFTVKDYGYEQAKQHAILWKTCNDERLIRNRVQQNKVMDLKMLDGSLESGISQNQWCVQPFQQPYLGYYQQQQNMEFCNPQNECLSQYDQHHMQQSLMPFKNSSLQSQQSVEARSPSLSTSASVSGYTDQNDQLCYNYQNELPYQFSQHQQYPYEQQQIQYVGEDMDHYPQDNEQEEDTCSVSGVTFDRKNRRWGARWTTADGRRAGRYFPVRQYGFNEAKRLAVICRLQAIEENRGGDVIPPLDLNMQQSCGELINEQF